MNQDWITQDADKPWLFTGHVDLIYPRVLAEMGVTGAPSQYDLEFAHNVIKLDAQMFMRQALRPPVMVASAPVLILEGGLPDDEDADAYKRRWGVKHAPPGKLADLREADVAAWERQVAAEAKAWYQQTRGYLPS